jgi:hypothetical protein
MLPNLRICGAPSGAEKPDRPREDAVPTSVGFEHLTIGVHLDRAIESHCEIGGLRVRGRDRSDWRFYSNRYGQIGGPKVPVSLLPFHREIVENATLFFAQCF